MRKCLASLPLFYLLAATDIYRHLWVYLHPLISGAAIPTVWSRASPGVVKLSTSSFGPQPPQSWSPAYTVLQRCEKLHLTLSRSKFQIETKLEFVGCVVSHDGVNPDPNRVTFPISLCQLTRCLYVPFWGCAIS